MRVVVLLRDPVAAAFAAEISLRNAGVALPWSLMEDLKAADPRFAATPEDVAYWQQARE